MYKHTNLTNGKVYIGVTGKKRPEQRWKKGEGYIENEHFYRAIQKYGWDGFSHEILQECSDVETALKYEGDYSKQYDSTNPEHGYNHVCGKDIEHFTISEETRAKVSYGLSGKPRKTHDTEDLRKMSEGLKAAALKSKYENLDNLIECYKLDGTFVGTYKNALIAQKELGLSGTSHLFDVCRGTRGSAYGYKWKYGDGFHHADKNINSRKVKMMSIDGKFSKDYNSLEELMKENNFKSKMHIVECCRHKRHSAYGYTFEFIE